MNVFIRIIKFIAGLFGARKKPAATSNKVAKDNYPMF